MMPWGTSGPGVGKTCVHTQTPRVCDRVCHGISAGLQVLVYNGDVKSTSLTVMKMK